MMWYRIYHSFRLCLISSAVKRADYLRKHKVFRHMGDNCMVMLRKIPLYPKLISFGDNVWVASGVSLIPHDVIHYMLNNIVDNHTFQENIGCIDIKDNVFIGSNTTVLPNVTVGPNVVIAAGSVVNKSIENGVWGGVPVRYIGSFKDLVDKRMKDIGFPVKKNRGDLTEETIEKCWSFYESSKQEK